MQQNYYVMNNGKYICDTLKKIRLDIARANGIEYSPRVCHHEGECSGTCPACESEMRFLEREIARKRSHGKAAIVAGVSLGLTCFMATSCDHVNQSVQSIVQSCNHNDGPYVGEVAAPTLEEDSIKAELYTMQSHNRIIDQAFMDGPKAVFPGGKGALFKFIKENFVCPEVEDKNTFSIIEVVIDPEGNVQDAMAYFTYDSVFNAEALRVTKLLPKFEPALDEKGTAVYSSYYLLFDAKRLGPEK